MEESRDPLSSGGEERAGYGVNRKDLNEKNVWLKPAATCEDPSEGCV